MYLRSFDSYLPVLPSLFKKSSKDFLTGHP
jgi:hypothetical protein